MAAFNAKEIGDAIDEAVDEEVRELGLRILSTAINMSPVGNPTLWNRPSSAPAGYVGGHFRRNWQVGNVADPTNEVAGVDASGQATLAAGTAIIRGYKRGRMFVVNNVPYANRIDEGHSTQAPAGISDAAVAVAIASVDRNRDI